MISFQVPASIEVELRRGFSDDLGRAALEALAVEGYRMAKLSAGEVAAKLGLETSFQALAWLGRRGVALNNSLEDLEADRAALGRFDSKRNAR